ncbi:MAG: O-antigen ligase family protein [Chloroflexia bacterium]
MEIAATPALDSLKRLVVPVGAAISLPFLLFPSRYTLIVAPVAAASLALALLRLRAEARFPRLDDLFVGLLAVLGVVGTFISVAPSLSVNRLMGLFAGVLVYYATQEYVRDRARALHVFELVALSGLAISLFAFVAVDWDRAIIVNPIPGLYDLFPRWLRGVSGSGVPRSSDLIGPREIGGTLAVIIPVALAVTSVVGSGPRRILYALSSALSIAVLLLTQTFLGWLAAVAALLLLGALLRPRATGLLVAILGALSLVALAVAGLLSGFSVPGGLGAYLDTSIQFGQRVTDHLQVTALALPIIRDTPWTGAGLNTFPVLATCYYPPARFPAFWLPHAHNLFIQTWLDFGLFGLLALLGLAVYLVRGFAVRWPRLRSTSQGRLYAAAICGPLAYALFGLADAIPLGAKPGIVVWMLLALLRTMPASEQEPGDQLAPTRATPANPPPTPRARRTALALLTLASATLLAGGLLTGSIQHNTALISCRLNNTCPPPYCGQSASQQPSVSKKP